MASQSLLTLSLSPAIIASLLAKLLLWIDNSLQSAGMRSPTAIVTISPGTSPSAFILCMRPFRITLASFAEYSCSAAIAISALLSCVTPTTAFRTRIVNIYKGCQSPCRWIWFLRLLNVRAAFLSITYHYGVHKGRPVVSLLEQCQHE